jgi:hypothetical protein
MTYRWHREIYCTCNVGVGVEDLGTSTRFFLHTCKVSRVHNGDKRLLHYLIDVCGESHDWNLHEGSLRAVTLLFLTHLNSSCDMFAGEVQWGGGGGGQLPSILQDSQYKPSPGRKQLLTTADGAVITERGGGGLHTNLLEGFTLIFAPY